LPNTRRSKETSSHPYLKKGAKNNTFRAVIFDHRLEGEKEETERRKRDYGTILIEEEEYPVPVAPIG